MVTFTELGYLIDYVLIEWPWKACFLVFSLMFLADVAWVLCVRKVQNNEAFLAGIWAVGIFIPTAWVTMGYVYNPYLFFPAALGHFAGTYATVKWAAKKKRQATTNVSSSTSNQVLWTEDPSYKPHNW